MEVETGVGREMGTETELLREWEREWRGGAEWVMPVGDTGLPNENAVICEQCQPELTTAQEGEIGRRTGHEVVRGGLPERV